MNHKQQTFITEYLRHRSAFTAYCLAYNLKDCSNYDSIMSAANRLLNLPEISSVIDSVLDNIRHEVEQELRAEMKTEMLTIQRKRELLAKIATGETYAVQNYKGKDCNMYVQHVWPTINQMLKAIDLDNKMVGLYASLHPSKPKAIPSLNVQVAEQVDKFLQSVGLFPEQTENSSFEGGIADAIGDGGCPLAPEESIETATNRNNIEVDEPQSGESYNSENSDSDKKYTESQQITTIVPPRACPAALREGCQRANGGGTLA